jgi:hypothetical protein
MAATNKMQPAPQNKTPRELIPADNYMATCYQMIYIGTVPEEYQGEQKQVPKVLLTWEIPSLMKVFKEERGLEPMVITKEFSFSMGEKANLRKFLSNWRGKAFTNDEANAFDIAVLLGQPCMLNVIHKTSEKSGNTYQDVGSASRLPSGIPAPQKINPAMEFDVRDWNQDKFNALPEWLQNKIKTSDEYKKSHGATEPSPAPVSAPVAPVQSGPPQDLPPLDLDNAPEDESPLPF